VDNGQRGLDAINQTTRIIDTINLQVESVSEKMVHLNEQNIHISEILESVNEIAEQSNLLAVNASIEAARAGDHGRGFSVVATEVRNLAEQSKRSTRQINRILSEIRKSSDMVLVSIEDCKTGAGSGKNLVKATQEVIENLTAVLEESSQKATQISGASSQQAAGIKQISEAMMSVAQGGQDTAASAKQLEMAVEGLSDIGRQLREMVSGRSA
jgi:methyl-accepting chemotaxis protein